MPRNHSHQEILDQRLADDKRRGVAREKDKPRPSPIYNPGLTLLYNPLRRFQRPSGIIVLPGRGSPAAGGLK